MKKDPDKFAKSFEESFEKVSKNKYSAKVKIRKDGNWFYLYNEEGNMKFSLRGFGSDREARIFASEKGWTVKNS